MKETNSKLTTRETRRKDCEKLVGHMAFDQEVGSIPESFIFSESKDWDGIALEAFQSKGHMNF